MSGLRGEEFSLVHLSTNIAHVNLIKSFSLVPSSQPYFSMLIALI